MLHAARNRRSGSAVNAAAASAAASAAVALSPASSSSPPPPPPPPPPLSPPAPARGDAVFVVDDELLRILREHNPGAQFVKMSAHAMSRFCDATQQHAPERQQPQQRAGERARGGV